MSKGTRVDIMVPCLNSARTLQHTLDSIKAQTHENLRVVLVDNGSKDDSIGIFERMADPRFEVRAYGDTLPLGSNLNRCLDLAESDLLCVMHADDEYSPGYVAGMLAAMQRHPSASLAFCDTVIINQNSEEVFSLKALLKERTARQHGPVFRGMAGLCWISEYNKITSPSVMYRREKMRGIRFDPALKFTLDWHLYMQVLLAGGEIVHVPQRMFRYRVHTGQQTAALKASLEKYEEMLEFLNIINLHLTNESSANASKYSFFRMTVLTDLVADLLSLQLHKAFSKAKFLVKSKSIALGEVD